MQLSGDLVLAHHVMEMTALTSGAEGRVAGKAGMGRPCRQNSLVMGGSKVDVPLSRSISVPAQHQTWPAPADGLVRILRTSKILGRACPLGQVQCTICQLNT